MFLARNFGEEIIYFPIGKLAISILWFRNLDNQSELNGNNRNLHNDNRMRGIALMSGFILMESYKDLYDQIISPGNLMIAWRKARKHKTKKIYVKEFEKDIIRNLLQLHEELKNQTYKPKPLITFILRDPKTRKISKSDFRDRIVHHAIVNILEPIFDKTFIHDSCANRKGKGTIFAIKRFDLFKRRITKNLKVEAFCLKADIKHYFQEVNHEVLLNIIERKIRDKKAIGLITKIIKNGLNDSSLSRKIGMPLGNLTSQFFANIYLNELDYFVKHKLNAKYYIRYVDDFIILHSSREQLRIWREQINNFLIKELKIELHPDKSKVISLSKSVDFVGFRNFYYFKLLRKRNIRKISLRIRDYNKGELSHEKLLEGLQGWKAYAKWSNSYKLTNSLAKSIKRLNSN